MCGRYQLTYDPRLRLTQLGIRQYRGPREILPRYNIAPSQQVLAIADGALQEMTWSWPPVGRASRPLINARAETAATSPLWRPALEERRCVLPATGFYEWRQPDRQPFLLRRHPDALMLLGGIWQRFPDGDRVVILTSAANPLVANIHDRQPVIVREEDIGKWFSPAFEQLLQPIHRGYLRAQPISTRINSPSSDSPHDVQVIPWDCPEYR